MIERLKDAAALSALSLAITFRRNAFTVGVFTGLWFAATAITFVMLTFGHSGTPFLARALDALTKAWPLTVLVIAFGTFAVCLYARRNIRTAPQGEEKP